MVNNDVLWRLMQIINNNNNNTFIQFLVWSVSLCAPCACANVSGMSPANILHSSLFYSFYKWEVSIVYCFPLPGIKSSHCRSHTHEKFSNFTSLPNFVFLERGVSIHINHFPQIGIKSVSSRFLPLNSANFTSPQFSLFGETSIFSYGA